MSDEHPGHTRRVVLVGSLVTLIVVAVVAASGVLGGSEPTANSVPSLGTAPDTDPATAEGDATATTSLESAPPLVVTDPSVDSILGVDNDEAEPVEAEDPAVVGDPDVVPAEPIAQPVEADDPEADPPAAPIEAPTGDVAESTGVVRNGQLFLSGAVPDAESADRIVALAAEVLGPDNVFNDYVIDPRASDPNLGNVTVEDTINFAPGSSAMLTGSENLLNQGLALMTVRPAVTITIVGHTDAQGSDEGNLALSLARAETVRQWFVDRGVDGARIAVQGAGSSQPIADNATADGRRLNRRIQFFLQNILGDA